MKRVSAPESRQQFPPILRLDMFGLLLATFLSLSQPWPGKHFKLLADQQKDGRIEMGVAEPIAMLIARLLTF